MQILSPKETICMKQQNLFSEKKKTYLKTSQKHTYINLTPLNTPFIL